MLILATDTSTPYLSIALCDNESIIAEVSLAADRKHAELILFHTDRILTETDTPLHNIDLLAVAQSPGSFTGVRVGVSAWKGLAAGANIPIIGVSTLDVLAHRAQGVTTICTLLDAKMGEVYAAVFTSDNGKQTLTQKPFVADIDTVLLQCPPDAAFIGDGATLYREEILKARPRAALLSEALCFPGATAVAGVALSMMAKGFQPDTTPVEPLYLRKSQAEVNLELSEARNSAE